VRVLITNIVLAGRTGTEIVTIELAQGLARRGHQVAVFAPFVGPSASILSAQNIPVTHRLRDLAWKPDVIHGHHSIALVPVLARYLDVPALFIMHDTTQDLNCPPSTPQIVRLFAVDEINREHFAREANIDPKRIDLLLNCVDLDRFEPRGPLPEQPQRALLLGKNVGHIDSVREAARRAGLTLDEIGPIFGRVVDDLNARVKDYDIVFATARMALEALAVGCAVIVCDGRGLAGMATSDVVDTWRSNNFGLKLLTRTPTAEALLEQVRRYSPRDAAIVSARIRELASLSGYIQRVEAVYRDILANWTCSFDDQRRHGEALGTFIADWVHRRGYPIVSGDIARTMVERDAALAQRDAALAARDAILQSRSGLLRQLLSVTLRKLRGNVNRTVAKPERPPNEALRTREYLTQAEVERQMAAAKGNRYGQRDEQS